MHAASTSTQPVGTLPGSDLTVLSEDPLLLAGHLAPRGLRIPVEQGLAPGELPPGSDAIVTRSHEVSMARWSTLLFLSAAALAPGCGDKAGDDDVVVDSGEPDGGTSDGGTSDGGTSDGGTSDGGTSDGGTSDGGTSDGGTSDGGTSDGGTSDGGTSDGGTSDGGTSDGGTSDGGTSDGGSEPEDLDGDGYTSDVDCDDDLDTVHPGAEEVCDGVDQDCDGVPDDDATDTLRWYRDADLDTYGDPDSSTLACDAPGVDWTLDDTDCDDGDRLIRPGVEEHCDDVDEDCDGEVDEDAVDPTAWYADVDSDGYGRESGEVWACDAPSGYVATTGDCDDSDEEMHPGATEHCDDVDEDCDDEVDEDAVDAGSWYADLDEDGYGDSADLFRSCEPPDGTVGAGGDCDDDDASVYPGATEHCDGDDEDCDGDVDEAATDAATWHRDADRDGYGHLTDTTAACSDPGDDWVSNDSDCDDGDASVHPGATEHCDGDDEDCDDEIDEDPSDPVAWALDGDGDGYASSDAETVEACDSPGDGWVGLAGDCDDADADVHPDAEEHCDAVDEDCDGAVDEDAVDRVVYLLDEDGDGYGADDSAGLSCSASDGYTETGGDCDDGDADVSPDANEQCLNGVDDDCDGTVDSCSGTAWDLADIVLSGPDDDVYCGQSAATGDLNGDGAPDALVACYNSLLVFDGPFTEDRSLSAPDGRIDDSSTSYTAYGEAVASGGDIDGDGIEDLVVGARYAEALSSASTGSGSVYVYYGPITSSISAEAEDAKSYQTSSYDYYGASVAVGDVDGDGYADYFAGAPGDAWGAVYGWFGPVSGTVKADLYADVLITEDYWGSDSIGETLAIADLDADGIDDLLIGAPGQSTWGANRGAVHIYDGPLSSMDVVLTDTHDEAWVGSNNNSDAGSWLNVPGDVNGDGYQDVLIGSPGYTSGSGTRRGACYLVYGPANTTGDWDTLDDADARVAGDSLSDEIGRCGALDMNGDGDWELWVRGYDTGAYSNDVYVFEGPHSSYTFTAYADLVIEDSDSVTTLGLAIDTRHDLDGDGLPDMLITDENASYSAGDGTLWNGAAYIFLAQ